MPDDIERLLTIGELGAMLGVPVDTLYGWRHRGVGLRATGSVDTCGIADQSSSRGWQLGWTPEASS